MQTAMIAYASSFNHFDLSATKRRAQVKLLSFVYVAGRRRPTSDPQIDAAAHSCAKQFRTCTITVGAQALV